MNNITEICALPGRLVLIPDSPKDRTTDTGLHIPGQLDRTRPATGVVCSVGQEPSKPRPLNRQTKNAEFQPGDRVVYQRHHGTEISYNRQTYFIVRPDNVIGLIPEDSVVAVS